MFVVFITLYIDKDIRVARSYSAEYLKKCLFSGIRVCHASILVHVSTISILHTLMLTSTRALVHMLLSMCMRSHVWSGFA